MNEREIARSEVTDFMATVIELDVLATPVDEAFIETADSMKSITPNCDRPALPILSDDLDSCRTQSI